MINRLEVVLAEQIRISKELAFQFGKIGSPMSCWCLSKEQLALDCLWRITNILTIGAHRLDVPLETERCL